MKFTRLNGFVKVEIGLIDISKAKVTDYVEDEELEIINRVSSNLDSMSFEKLSFKGSNNDYILKVDPTNNQKIMSFNNNELNRTSSIND